MSLPTPTETPVRSPRTAPPTELRITGMTCSNCARHVTEALQSVAGVASGAVRLDEGRAEVRWQTGAQPALESLMHAVKQAGYAAAPVEGHESKAEGQGQWSPMNPQVAMHRRFKIGGSGVVVAWRPNGMERRCDLVR